MPVIEYLERNADLYGDEVALVELNPEEKDSRRVTWKEFDLIQADSFQPYRREITWSVFDEKANRFANMLLGRGIKKGDKVAIIMYNCLEWLPIYFGVLKTGAIAVPFNFRYDADEILYCAELAEVDVIVFDPAFIGRIEQYADKLSINRLLIYVGDGCPSFAESYRELVAEGIKLHPLFQDEYIDGIGYMRLIEKASELDLITVIHAGYDISYPDKDFASVAHMLNMIKQVQPRNVVLAHMGGWGEWDAVESDLCGADVYFDTSFCMTPIRPFDPEAEHVCKTALGREQFARIVRKHGADKILFGSDSPWAKQSEAIAVVEKSGLEEGEVKQILGINAQKLFFSKQDSI